MDLSYAEDEEAELLAAEQCSFEQKLCFGPERWLVSGKREVPVGAGRPTGEELSSVEPDGGGGQQGLAPKRAVLSNTERVCKPGLLVVQATVKGLEKPWAILIDSGASGNYARRSTMKGSQLYAEALRACDRDIVTVRLATGTRVTVPKVPVDLGVKFLDFDSVERYLVLDLDARYDLILGMAWLEHRESWIDWRSKTLGATHFSPRGALASHEPTSARKQKRFWREHWAEMVNVLDIGMSKMMDTESVVDKSPEQSSWAERGTAHNPLSNARGEAASLHVDGGMDRSPERSSWTERGVALAQNPLSEGCGQSSTSLSVGRDTEAPLELEEVMTPEGAADAHTKASRRRTTSALRRWRRKMLAARRMASEMSRDVNGVASGTALHDSDQLYTLVNGVTGDVDGDVNLGAVPTLAALLELDKMSFGEFGEALQVGKLAEVVVMRPEVGLTPSSLLDEAALDHAKKALNARSGSEILKDPSDPFYSVIREYQDVVSKEPPSGLPPDRGVRHEIDPVLGTKYCVTRQWPLPREQCDVIDAFFRAKHEAGLVRESKSPHSTPTFCVKSQRASGVKTIVEWPVPRKQKDLRKWLGLANYLHKYSENYDEMARALSNLLKKDAEWRWSAEHQHAFEAINDSLLHTPILALPDPDRPFSVVCDASDFGIRCALLQADTEGRERVIAFESRQLKTAGKNFQYKELLAMKYALVKFRAHLLASKPFVIYTAHASLRTATQSPHPSQRMARWLSYFAEYNIEVKYKTGKQNALADALSRRLDYELAHVNTATSSIPDLIRASYASDDKCVALLKALGSKEFEDSDKELSARLRARLHRYAFDGGLLTASSMRHTTPRLAVISDEKRPTAR
ncbi:unnamed protein product [Phytophthora fragariaefolia]|uniref:Unnamed protein product n=1 Tax=Phytophthora fragariaefolia TaxID=1490495 RepID=A0A9W7D0Z5_9STRA|nr:unnamed protein product [Phytophthora fragariaefolia]